MAGAHVSYMVAVVLCFPVVPVPGALRYGLHEGTKWGNKVLVTSLSTLTLCNGMGRFSLVLYVHRGLLLVQLAADSKYSKV